MVAEGDRPLADRRPDPAPDRLQAEAVLVRGPDLDRPIGMRRLGLRDGLLKPLLKSARRSGAAARACRGRGAWMDQPIRRRSEEHTSELQSRQYLVCRLLLEKKKITKCFHITSSHE